MQALDGVFKSPKDAVWPRHADHAARNKPSWLFSRTTSDFLHWMYPYIHTFNAGMQD